MNSSTETLARFVSQRSRLFVITGAGCSAPSGIETYRDDHGEWHKPAPIQHQDFVSSEAARRRYWARSLRGWPMFALAQANDAHRALARLEASGRIDCVVTQNVDGLHQQAGANNVIELHGSLASVVCLSCETKSSRAQLQQRLIEMNPQLLNVPVQAAPDGDADLGGAEDSSSIRVPVCELCSGMLKPDVVFYGDSVPRPRVDQAFAALEQADGLLVVGSSLMVFSSFRFCRRARQLGLPMAAINQGRTRADEFFDVNVEADCAIVLRKLLVSDGVT